MKTPVRESSPAENMRRPVAFLALCLLVCAGILGLRYRSVAQPPTAPAPDKAPDPPIEIAALRAELEQLKGKVPDQSHAMKDVGYHFANLWFAARNKNWPLAKFYLDETRSHLKWAVRIIPVRKTKVGDLDLRGILEAVDSTLLSQVQKAVEKQDLKNFNDTYRKALEGCYSCHKAAEKPFLRPRIPQEPESRMINFDPEARWPE